MKPTPIPAAGPLPWWMSPSGITLGFLMPMLFLILLVGQADMPGLTVRGLRFLTPALLALAVGMLAAMAVAGWIGGQLWDRRTPLPPDSAHAAWDRAAAVVGTLALVAYAIWFRDFLLDPALLAATLTGAFKPDRTLITLTPGLTSLANVAPVFFSIYAFRAFGRAAVRPSAVLHLLALLLVVFTLFRVYAWSERLALIEASTAFALAGAVAACRDGRPWLRTLVRLGPFAALPAVVLFFGIAESVRSWTSPTYSGKMGFWEFAIGRIASYYYTSLNNGAGLMSTLDWPTLRFDFTLFWLHRAPLSIGPVFADIVNVDTAYFEPEPFLAKWGDEEFNNPSGLFAVVCDLGIPGAIAYFAVISLLAGYLCQAYRRGALAGVLLYPMLFLTHLELFRYPYLGTPRAFTWAVGIAVAWAIATLGGAQRYTVAKKGAS